MQETSKGKMSYSSNVAEETSGRAEGRAQLSCVVVRDCVVSLRTPKGFSVLE